MGQPLKIAIAGTGYGAKVALPGYRDLDEFEPVGVWSRNPERARSVASDYDLALGTSDFEELVSLPGLEAIHIASPVVTHLPLVLAAASRGLHVLCEKPLAANLAEARSIAEAIQRAGVVGAVGYELRMKQTRRRLIEHAREVVGRPRMALISLVHSDHADPFSRPYTWVHDATMGGGRLQGYGVHDLDLLWAIFPGIEAVAAATEVGVTTRTSEDGSLRPVTAEDTYGLLVRFRGGGLGVISLVATARHSRGDVIELYGDEGTARLDPDGCVWWGRAGEQLQCEGPLSNDSIESFKALALKFWGAVRHGQPPDPSLEEGLAVQAVFDAARIAHIERRWVHPEPIGTVRPIVA